MFVRMLIDSKDLCRDESNSAPLPRSDFLGSVFKASVNWGIILRDSWGAILRAVLTPYRRWNANARV
jgi:hypothetical protein